MEMVRKGKIHVNFVADHFYPVFLADTPDFLQFFQGPHPAHGIVGGAKQKELHVFPSDFFLKIRKINFVPAVFLHQRTFH